MTTLSRPQPAASNPPSTLSAPIMPRIAQPAALFTEDLYLARPPPPARTVINGETRTDWKVAFDAAYSILATACRKLWFWGRRAISLLLDTLATLGTKFADLLASWGKADATVDANASLQERTRLLSSMIDTAIRLDKTFEEAKRDLELSSEDEALFNSLWERAQQQAEANLEAAERRVAELRSRWNNRNRRV